MKNTRGLYNRFLYLYKGEESETLSYTSPVKIEKITKTGMFDDCLFFSTERYVMTQAKTVFTYTIDIPDNKIIDVSELHDESVIKNIMDVLEVDEESAERMLDERDTAFDHGKDGEDDWWIQAKQGECAKLMGYEACESSDEQGTVYIVPMFGRENDLILIGSNGTDSIKDRFNDIESAKSYKQLLSGVKKIVKET